MTTTRTTNDRLTLPPPDAHPLDWELLVCTHVLGLTSLHWGLWYDGLPVSLDGLREAQERFSDTIVESLPDSVHTVLDVGCGTGDLARRLGRTGRHVTAIAPIANYEHELNVLEFTGIDWVCSRLQDLEDIGPYDAVMMIESAGYFPVVAGLKKAHNLLSPGGWLLVANPFRTADVDIQVARHVLADYLDAARDVGFQLVEERDITDAVLPTLALARQFRRDHLEPAVGLLRFAAMRSRPIRTAMGVCAFLFRRRIAAIRKKLAVSREQLDPDLFRAHAKYLVLLFRKGA